MAKDGNKRSNSSKTSATIITSTSSGHWPRTIQRDLAKLQTKGIITREGGRKSIREQFDISTGDMIEFFTDGDNIILQKISYDSNPSDELRRIAKKYADEIPSGLAEQITNIAQYLEHKSAE